MEIFGDLLIKNILLRSDRVRTKCWRAIVGFAETEGFPALVKVLVLAEHG